MRAPHAALTALEVAIGRGSATLLRLQLIRIHAQTHRAARLAPLGAGSPEARFEAPSLSLSALPVTSSDEDDMAIAATSGLAYPMTASGIAMAL